MRERKCDRCGEVFVSGYKEHVCQRCLVELGWHSTPCTNADRIRTMNDEELAVWLMDAHDGGIHIPFCKDKEECAERLEDGDIPESECLQCMVDWLRKEVGERERGERMQRMKDVVWMWGDGLYKPFCPYCFEPAREPERCSVCGEEYNFEGDTNGEE